VQPVLQAAAAHANGVQSVMDVGAQWPAPSQVEAPASVAAPALQPAGAHDVPAA
jgi:hypothetical protein